MQESIAVLFVHAGTMLTWKESEIFSCGYLCHGLGICKTKQHSDTPSISWTSLTLIVSLHITVGLLDLCQVHLVPINEVAVHLWMGSPPHCLTCHQVNSAFRPSRVAKSSASFGTSAGWQVTLCDPTWHVSSHGSEAKLLLTGMCLPVLHVHVCIRMCV